MYLVSLLPFYYFNCIISIWSRSAPCLHLPLKPFLSLLSVFCSRLAGRSPSWSPARSGLSSTRTVRGAAEMSSSTPAPRRGARRKLPSLWVMFVLSVYVFVWEKKLFVQVLLSCQLTPNNLKLIAEQSLSSYLPVFLSQSSFNIEYRSGESVLRLKHLHVAIHETAQRHNCWC